jgi:hypothetical protein
MLGGPQGRSEYCGEEKKVLHYRKSNPYRPARDDVVTSSFSNFLGWGETWVHLVRRPLIGLMYQPRMIDDDERGAVVEWELARETCPSATLSTTNPTWTDLSANPGRRGGKPATNRLSYGKTLQSVRLIWSYTSTAYVVIDSNMTGLHRCTTQPENKNILLKVTTASVV